MSFRSLSVLEYNIFCSTLIQFSDIDLTPAFLANLVKAGLVIPFHFRHLFVLYIFLNLIYFPSTKL